MVQTWPGVTAGSFNAPDHEYPSYLELRLTATDSGGLRDTEALRLDPRTVVLTFQTNPGGLRLTVGSTTSTATFTRTVIVGSKNSVSALSPQRKGNKNYTLCRGRMAGRRPTTSSPRPPRPPDHLHGQVPQLTDGAGGRWPGRSSRPGYPQTAPWSAPPTRRAYLARAPVV